MPLGKACHLVGGENGRSDKMHEVSAGVYR